MPTLTSSLQSETGTIDKMGVRGYVREYIVVCDTPDPTTAQVAAVLPVWGALHPDDPHARVKSASVKQRGPGAYQWDGTVNYDTAQDVTDRGTVRQGGTGTPDSAGGNSNQVAPNLRPWVFKWGARHRSEHFLQDRDGTDARNAAGQFFDGGLELPVCNPTLTITGYKLIDPGGGPLSLSLGARDIAKIRDYVDHVNDAPYLAWLAGEARCTEYALTTQYEFGLFYWQVDVTIEFQRGGWNPIKVLNAGTFTKGDYSTVTHSYGKPKPITIRGVPITHPTPLSADGTRALNPADPADVPNYINFTGYESTDFEFII